MPLLICWSDPLVGQKLVAALAASKQSARLVRDLDAVEKAAEAGDWIVVDLRRSDALTWLGGTRRNPVGIIAVGKEPKSGANAKRALRAGASAYLRVDGPISDLATAITDEIAKVKTRPYSFALPDRFQLLGGDGLKVKARDTVTHEFVELQEIDADRAEVFIKKDVFDHPNLSRMFSVGRTGKKVVVATEWLQDPLTGRLSTSNAVTVFRGILGGLDHLHQSGVVFRDVRPENIRIDVKGIFKLDSAAILGGKKLVRSGYLAPELRRAPGKINLRAPVDVYGAGMSLYTTVTGSVPPTTKAVATMRAKLEGEPDWLREAILRATAPDPNQRFEDAGEFLRALEGPRSRRAKPPTELYLGDEDDDESDDDESDDDENDADKGTTLHWNVSFPEDAVVRKRRILFAGTAYRMRIALDGRAIPDSAVSVAVGNKELFGEGVEVPIRFQVDGSNAEISLAGSETRTSQFVSEPMRCVLGKGTGELLLDVTAKTPGPVELTFTLRVRETMLLRQALSLKAVADPDQPAAEPDGESQAPPLQTAVLDQATLASILPTSVVVSISEGKRGFLIQVTLDGVKNAHTAESHRSREEIVKEAVRVRKELVLLSDKYASTPAGAGDPLSGLRLQQPAESMLAFARLGQSLYEHFFGVPDDENVEPNLRAISKLISGLASQPPPAMQIDAESLPFPWGILYDGDSSAGVDAGRFWGRRFSIARIASVVLSHVRVQSFGGKVQLLPCVNPHIDHEQKLGVVEAQRAFFAEAGKSGKAQIRPAIESSEAFKEFLVKDDGSPANLLYFFCHATAAHEVSDNLFAVTSPADDQATITLDPEDNAKSISVRALRQIRKLPLNGQPLVFMNACSSAQADSVYQSLFLSLFMGTWNARGFIGTDWKVPTVFADAFSRRVLRDFLFDGCPLGRAFSKASADVIDAGNPFPMIYAIFARPDLRAA